MPELDDVRIEEDDKKDFYTEKSMLGKRPRDDSSGDESPSGKMAHIFKEIVKNANSDKLSLQKYEKLMANYKTDSYRD